MEQFGHLPVSLSPPFCPCIYSPYLLDLFFGLSICDVPICLPRHPSLRRPLPQHHLFFPSLIHLFTFPHPQFICSLLLYLLTGPFTFLLTYVPTLPPNCPSIRPSSRHPLNLITSCLPVFSCIHCSPPRLLTKQLQLFPEEMGLAFLVFPTVLLVPIWVTTYWDF